MTAPKRARPSRRFPIYSLLDSSAEQLGGQQRAEGRHLCGGQPTQKRVFPPWGPYVCSVIVSVADTQADCVFGYRDICGFNSDTCSKYDVMKAVDSMLHGYDTDAGGSMRKGKATACAAGRIPMKRPITTILSPLPPIPCWRIFYTACGARITPRHGRENVRWR